MIRILSFFGAVLLLSCVSTEYKLPDMATQDHSQLTTELQQEAIAFHLARRARLYDLSWPVLTQNTELCPQTRPSLGLVLVDLKTLTAMIDGLTIDQLKAAGFVEGIQILHVMKGSPAEQAGFRKGNILLAINGQTIASDAKVAMATKPIAKALKEDKKVDLQWQSGGQVKEVALEPIDVCEAAVKLSTADPINAYASFNEIIVTAGMMRNASDAALQFVISHELAHVAAQHSRKLTRNYIVSGAIIYRPVLGMGGAVIDRALSAVKVNRPGSLAARGLAIAAPYQPDFEAEADYLGLYMYARAGGDLSQAEEIFHLFAAEQPSGIWLEYTHPVYPARISVLRATIEEMNAQAAQGQELMPRSH
ncbi:MAG: M48 family metalloprotease [bacterium]